MTYRKAIETGMNEILRAYGFRRGSRGAWFAEKAESTLVVELQRSRWGEEYYVNLGVVLHQLKTPSLPIQDQCHIYGRLAGLLPPDLQATTILRFGQGEDSDRDAVRRFLSLTADHVIPFLHSIQTLDGINHAWKSGKLRRFGVDVKLQPLLDEKAARENPTE